jgi:CheY-like chemotaxis protein
MLDRWGMQAVPAAGGVEAMDLFRQTDPQAGPFALLLVDAHMPGMDGFELVARLVKEADLSHTTVMMLTSSARSRDPARVRELGIAACLAKPVMQGQLSDAILAAMGRKAAAEKALPMADRAARLGESGLRVLLAEDNAVNQKLASRLLERRGHTVAVASNGRQALEMLDKQSFDLVVLDVSMPEMDGFEAAAAIRAREKTSGARIPILAMTAHAMKGDREKCLAAGMDGYVAKPVRAAQLFAAIASVTAVRA